MGGLRAYLLDHFSVVGDSNAVALGDVRVAGCVWVLLFCWCVHTCLS